MGELLLGASIITAFVAGIAALFAPCCITVLLPAYLGSVFRRMKTIFLMTFVFFLGLLAVFLPLGLGFAALGEAFRQFHDVIFIGGSVFLIVLGASMLLGKHFSMPFALRPSPKVSGAVSVFALGVFSGIATLCCAPVLAGVLALSIMPGSVFWGGVYSFAYVLGMTLPLFLIAFALDKSAALEKIGALNRPVEYSLGGEKIILIASEMVAALMFIGMGLLTIYLFSTGQLAQNSGFQVSTNVMLAGVSDSASKYFSWVPPVALAGAVVLVLAGLAFIAFKEKHGPGNEKRGS